MSTFNANKLRGYLHTAARLPVQILIRAYQLFISPLIGPRCRYLPTCSSYMLEAIETHGVVIGLALGLKRIGRCHPWGQHGYDPVPEKKLSD